MRRASVDPFDVGPFSRWHPDPSRRSGRWSVMRRAVVAAAVTWLPLVLLAAVQALLLPPTDGKSVLVDITVYARYLVAVPLFVAAEGITLPRLAAIARHFVDAELVAERDRSRYDAVTASVRRLLGHRALAPVLLAIACAGAGYRLLYSPEHGGWLVPRREDWFTMVVNGERTLSLVGWWVLLVSQPFFLFLAATWAWRLVVWARFLWGMARLDLQLVPGHPDRAAGLYFTAGSLPAFGFVALPISAAFAGVVAEEVLWFGRPPEAYQYIVLGSCAALVFGFSAPLCVFTGVLRRARQCGALEYGRLAALVGRVWERRWLGPGAAISEDALSRPDFSATIDLYSIVANAQQIRLVPVGLAPLALLTVGTIFPYLLVAIAAFPIDRVLRALRALLL